MQSPPKVGVRVPRNLQRRRQRGSEERGRAWRWLSDTCQVLRIEGAGAPHQLELARKHTGGMNAREKKNMY